MAKINKAVKMLAKLEAITLINMAKLKNYISYKQGNTPYFEYKLRKRFLKKVNLFGVTDFYQSYPPLMIRGMRGTLSRFQVYQLDQFLSTKKEILDIGGNIGFFSLYVSRFVKSVDIVEKEPNLTELGEKLKNFEKINNVNIINSDFKQFHTDKRYDIVFSFAIHRWVGLSFEEYLKRISNLLKKRGILLIESHSIRFKGGDYIEEKLKRTKEYKLLSKGRIDDQRGRIREFFYLQKK